MPTRFAPDARTPVTVAARHGLITATLVAAATLALMPRSDVRAQTSASSSEAGPPRKFVLTPRFSNSVVATDNVNLSTVGKESDVYLQLSPGLSLQSNGGRVRGSLDYSPSAYVYSKASEKNRVSHALNAVFTTEGR
ncbi:MAG: hypothetical protein HEQ39_03585 [Rhizobacter sp.]